MVRPQRQKKSVDYSQFDDSDSDDDFVAATAPLSKKPKTKLKEERPNPKLKTLQKEDIPQEEAPKKRMALDDKLYKRDLEVALALSVKELPTVPAGVAEFPDKSVEKLDRDGLETVTRSPHISNCSVAGDYLDLDKITEEEDLHGVQGKRKAASKAVAQQRMMVLEGSDGESSEESEESEPDFATGEESKDESDFEESDDEDEDLTVRKSKGSKAKDVKRKDVKVKPPVEKREKKPRSRSTSVASAPAAVKAECLSPSNTGFLSSAAPRTPLQAHSAPAESKRPKWTPPAASGSSSGGRPLAAVSMKSPGQSLRLGLSRLARVKPLHPSATSV
nr:unnamed protein product [Sorex araneus]